MSFLNSCIRELINLGFVKDHNNIDCTQYYYRLPLNRGLYTILLNEIQKGDLVKFKNSDKKGDVVLHSRIWDVKGVDYKVEIEGVTINTIAQLKFLIEQTRVWRWSCLQESYSAEITN